MEETILVINPGSTSTKLALFSQGHCLAEQKLQHATGEIAQFKRIPDQKAFRKDAILKFLKDQQVTTLSAVVGRGGLLKPIVGGTYRVNADMLEDLIAEKYNTHACNLGAILADEIAKSYGVEAYIVDPVVVDEFEPLARLSGLAGMDRRSVAHILNQKAVARKALTEMGSSYQKGNAIVAHMGGGITVGAHQRGKIIDISNGLDGEGPYSPERTGSLPLIEFARKIIDEGLNLAQVKKLLAGSGGLKSYLDEIDLKILADRIDEGDDQVKYYVDGMSYQIAKTIGEMATVLKGHIDVIVLTGGISYCDQVVQEIQSRVAFLAPVRIYPGEMEMEALYQGAHRVLVGEEEALVYESDK